MTRPSKPALSAFALATLVAFAGAAGLLRLPEATAPAQPFWQLQGAGPAVGSEPAAVRQLRTAQRDRDIPELMANAD